MKHRAHRRGVIETATYGRSSPAGGVGSFSQIATNLIYIKIVADSSPASLEFLAAFKQDVA